MDKCLNLYYNQDKDYFVCATDDEVDMLDKRFIKLSVQPMDSLKNRMDKFLKHHMPGGEKKEEETEDQDEERKKDKNTRINFDINLEELPKCSLTGPTGLNDYIVSFGFEYEKGSLYLLHTGPHGWENYLLSDGRYNQKVTVKQKEKEVENHLLQITPDSALQHGLKPTN